MRQEKILSGQNGELFLIVFCVSWMSINVVCLRHSEVHTVACKLRKFESNVSYLICWENSESSENLKKRIIRKRSLITSHNIVSFFNSTLHCATIFV